MDKRFRYGVCEWALPYDGKYGCEIARRAGYEGIQIDLGNYDRAFPLSQKEMQHAYLDAAQKWEITYPSLAVTTLGKFGVKMVGRNGSEAKRLAFAALEKAVQTAEYMKIGNIMVPSFFDDEIRTSEDLAETAECLRYACDLAEAKGIVISVENLLSAEDGLKLIKMVGRDNVKVYFDTQNYNLFRGWCTIEMFHAFEDYICEIHVKDGQNALSGALLGDGTTFFQKVAETCIVPSNYAGWIVSENYYDQKPLSDTGDDPYALLAEDLKRMQKAFPN